MLAPAAWGQVEPFSKKVGEYKIADVKPLPETGSFEMPFILWGGDVATFYANGGLETKDGSLLHKQGLNLKLVPGDDFLKQVKDYVEGRSAFLRGTLSMIGLASEVVGSDPRTKPVIFLQMTWSHGDHMVARESTKTLNDLKGKKICLQKDGPHVGMLDDALRTANLTWKDINVVWVDKISGPMGPAETFRKDASIDACFVISPDMTGLTGGLRSVGSGAEMTVKGAQVILSTADMSKSIVDVYACRKDFFDKHRDLIEKFTVGYLKACEEIDAIKPGKDPKKEPGMPAKYKELCALAVDVYSKNPETKGAVANEADADGLISDCVFTGLKENYQFFKAPKNPIGFEAKQKSALDLATGQGYATKRSDFIPVDFDWAKLKTAGMLKEELSVEVTPIFGPEGPKGTLKPIYSFKINFDANDPDFPEEKYGADFQKAVELGKLYGDAVIEIRGHADPTFLFQQIIGAGLTKGIFKDAGGGVYTLKDGTTKVDLKDVNAMIALIGKEDFNPDDKKTYEESIESLQKLSNDRAESVRKSVVAYAESKGYKIDKSQMKIAGVGVKEPVSVVLPRNKDEMAKNRRVEFRISAVVE